MDKKEKEIINHVIDNLVFIMNLTDKTSDTSIIDMYLESRYTIEKSLELLNKLIK